MANTGEIKRRACKLCRTIKYYREGEYLGQCSHCGGHDFGPASIALRPGRGYELSSADRDFLRVQRINPEED